MTPSSRCARTGTCSRTRSPLHGGKTRSRASGEAEEALPRLGQGHQLTELRVNAADCLFRLGRWDDALHLIEEARRRQRPGEEPVRLSELDIARGSFTKVRSYLERQLAGAPCRQPGAARLPICEPRGDRDLGAAVRRRAWIRRVGGSHSPATWTNRSRVATCVRPACGPRPIGSVQARAGNRSKEVDAAVEVGMRLLDQPPGDDAAPGSGRGLEAGGRRTVDRVRGRGHPSTQ